jgi:hypothetical protein
VVSFEVDRVEADQGNAWSVLVRALVVVLQRDPPAGAAELPQPLVPTPGGVMLVIGVDVVSGPRFPLVARDSRHSPWQGDCARASHLHVFKFTQHDRRFRVTVTDRYRP